MKKERRKQMRTRRQKRRTKINRLIKIQHDKKVIADFKDFLIGYSSDTTTLAKCDEIVNKFGEAMFATLSFSQMCDYTTYGAENLGIYRDFLGEHLAYGQNCSPEWMYPLLPLGEAEDICITHDKIVLILKCAQEGNEWAWNVVKHLASRGILEYGKPLNEYHPICVGPGAKKFRIVYDSNPDDEFGYLDVWEVYEDRTFTCEYNKYYK